MQRIGRAVEADIGGAHAAREQLVEPRRVAALMHHAALVHDLHEIRFEGRHLSLDDLFTKGGGCNTGQTTSQRTQR